MALEAAIQGTIVRVMETWPLQLVIATPQGNLQVPLREDTEILLPGGASGSVRMLRSGRKVRVEGKVVVIE
jgi:hypothetical protein